MDDLSGLLMLCIALAIAIVLFLAIRAIVLWYWHIDNFVENQKTQINLLSKLLDLLEKNQVPLSEPWSREEQTFTQSTEDKPDYDQKH
jgi:uncharacterized protein YpmB